MAISIRRAVDSSSRHRPPLFSVVSLAPPTSTFQRAVVLYVLQVRRILRTCTRRQSEKGSPLHRSSSPHGGISRGPSQRAGPSLFIIDLPSFLRRRNGLPAPDVTRSSRTGGWSRTGRNGPSRATRCRISFTHASCTRGSSPGKPLSGIWPS